MSTSLLYHAFGVVGYRYRRQSFEGGAVTFHIEQPRERHRCSLCGSDEVWDQGGVERTLRAVPIGRKPTFLTLKVPRVFCFACGALRQVKLGFADPKKHYTRAFERYALDLSRHMTIKDVARHLEVSWDTIKDIQARSLQRRFGKPKLHKLRQIAIDVRKRWQEPFLEGNLHGQSRARTHSQRDPRPSIHADRTRLRRNGGG